MKKLLILILAFMLLFSFAGCQTQEIDFGVENVSVVEQSEKVKLAENTYGQVFLLVEDSNEESGQVATRYLAIVLEDKKIVKTLSESYDGNITLCDFDGDGVYEIKGKQYTSLVGHADGVGIANTVLKYNKETAMFEVVDASFELLE